MDTLARWDLTHRIALKNKDEFGQTAEALNTAIEQLQNVLLIASRISNMKKNIELSLARSEGSFTLSKEIEKRSNIIRDNSIDSKNEGMMIYKESKEILQKSLDDVK